MALGGLLNLVGSPEVRAPVARGGTRAEYATCGICAFTGSRRGAAEIATSPARGQLVDVSALESIAFMEWKSAANFEATGSVRRRVGLLPQSMVLPTRDGWFGLLVPFRSHTGRRCRRADRGEKGFDDERFSNAAHAGRVAHADELRALLSDWFAQRTKHEIYHAAQALRIPAGMVAEAPGPARIRAVRRTGLLGDRDHPVTGPVTYPGWALITSAATLPPASAGRPCPGGAHKKKKMTTDGRSTSGREREE